MTNTNDTARDPAAIQSSIEQTREEMSATIDAIQRRLTPGQLMDQTLGYLRHSLPADFGANLANTVRDNPVPVTLIGVGIAWLALSGQSTGGYASVRRSSTDGEWAGDGSTDTGSTLRRAATATGDAASSFKNKATEVSGRARDIARDARDHITSTAHDARDRMRDLTERSQDQYDRARRTVSNLLDEQPLVVGALGIAIGAALGASLPRTRTEDEMMGEASDGLVEKAKAGADDYAQRAKDSVREAVDTLDTSTGTDSNSAPSTGTSRQGDGGAHVGASRFGGEPNRTEPRL